MAMMLSEAGIVLDEYTFNRVLEKEVTRFRIPVTHPEIKSSLCTFRYDGDDSEYDEEDRKGNHYIELVNVRDDGSEHPTEQYIDMGKGPLEVVEGTAVPLAEPWSIISIYKDVDRHLANIRYSNNGDLREYRWYDEHTDFISGYNAMMRFMRKYGITCTDMTYAADKIPEFLVRYHILITDITIERVQSQCARVIGRGEGFMRVDGSNKARQVDYAAWWDSKWGTLYPYENNPVTWVYTFKVMRTDG